MDPFLIPVVQSSSLREGDAVLLVLFLACCATPLALLIQIMRSV